MQVPWPIIESFKNTSYLLVKIAHRFLLENSQIMWILGVVAWGPTPSSHMHHPVDPLLWRSARELIEGFSPTLQRRIFLGLRFLPSIFLFQFPFSHLTFIPLLFSVVHACCPSAVFVVLMQSSFSVRNMDSTPEPPSPNMAAAAPAKRKFRKCSHCPSRMPSFAFDNHTLCTKCRNQVCDLELVCDECSDWPLPKRKVFVNYNNSLRARREYKQRKARLAGAASDQSVYDTDTDVPLDEPSVPVQNVHFDSVGQQQCLVSEEVVVSSAPSTEVAQSDVLLLSSGDGLDKLAASIFSRLSDLQSARGRPPTPVQSHSVGSEISQPSVCQPGVADTDFVGVSAPPSIFT